MVEKLKTVPGVRAQVRINFGLNALVHAVNSYRAVEYKTVRLNSTNFILYHFASYRIEAYIKIENDYMITVHFPFAGKNPQNRLLELFRLAYISLPVPLEAHYEKEAFPIRTFIVFGDKNDI